MDVYRWSAVDEFLNRSAELSQLDRWWSDRTLEPLAIVGRRRVGKSWLFRRFAHDKPAVLLVSEQLPPGVQLRRFADILEPVLGNRPDLPDVPTLFRVLFRLGRERKVLVVIDEVPWLLGSGPEAGRTLTSIQAVMEEERDDSSLKLILCGSQVSSMEGLFAEQSPMHGRLRRLPVLPLSFEDARPFLAGRSGLDDFERFAITGGMPRYLSRLASGPLARAVCEEVLNPNAPLANEGRLIVEQELREPRMYFALLERLASGPKSLGEIAAPLGVGTNAVAKYLHTLIDLRLVSKKEPFGAAANSRASRWQLDDSFLRFWFRFAFPFQSDLEAGLPSRSLYDAEVAPLVADHVAPVFEEWCRSWLRRNRAADVTRVGTWWGNALDELRRTGERSTEEIDAVGARQGRVTLVAEAKWTTTKLGPAIIADLDAYKIPAIRRSGLRTAERIDIVLFSKAGYHGALHRLAESDDRITLVDVERELASGS